MDGEEEERERRRIGEMKAMSLPCPSIILHHFGSCFLFTLLSVKAPGTH